MASAASEQGSSPGSRSVSYTHLDVYKRQELYRYRDVLCRQRNAGVDRGHHPRWDVRLVLRVNALAGMPVSARAE